MKRNIHRLELKNYLEGGSRFSVVRRFYSGDNKRVGWHTHEFAELFWVTRGKCRHTIEDGVETLTAGDVRFMRPDHPHSIDRIGRTPLHVTNIMCPAGMLESWRGSSPLPYGNFFLGHGSRPGGLNLNATELDELEQQTERLSMRTDDLFFLHRFLFDLFFNALPHATDTRDIPGWLKRGLSALNNPSVYSKGATAFASACGRSPEHVSRACRKYLGETPSELVNRARIKDAAWHLRMSDNTILNIMMSCGLSNPSHFYKLFKAQYGETPRQYRLTHSD